MNTVYVNFMPRYAGAPVSLTLLRANMGAVVSAVIARIAAGDKLRILLPDNAVDVAGALGNAAAACGASATAVYGSNPDDQAEQDGADIAITLNDSSFGFVYNNDRAAAAVFVGERPIPQRKCGEPGLDGSPAPVLVSGQAWLRDAGIVTGGSYAALAVDDGEFGEPVLLAQGCTGLDVLKAAGVEPDEAKALYLGFPSSTFIPAQKMSQPVDLSGGCDAIWVYTARSCMAAVLSRMASTWHAESCGHCVFGHEGSWQIATILADIVGKRGQAGDLDTFRSLCPVMQDNTVCDVDATLARTVQQAVELFGDEIAAHIGQRTCPAGECEAFKTYHVLVSKCIGCGDCLAACEDGAIAGMSEFVHVINQNKCTQCGRCREACKYGAVVRAGAKKPKTPPRPIPCRAKA